jgi:hypothetical protein
VQLLEWLLPTSDASAEVRVPGALRLALAHAMGTLDGPPYQSLDAFAETLKRFSPIDTRNAMRNLVARWAEAAELAAADSREQPLDAASVAEDEPSAPLTISDIRRARRATGLPLSEIAERSRIPLDLLRQLEWGYLRNWPEGLYGRTQLVRYARASGLDEQLVIETVWPMLNAAAAARPEASAELKPEASAELKPEASAELKPEASAEVKPEASAELKPEAEAELKPEVAVKWKRDVAVEAKPEVAGRPKPDVPAAIPQPIAAPISTPDVATAQPSIEEQAPPAETPMRLGLEDFPAEGEPDREVREEPKPEPAVATTVEVVAAEQALVWEPEISRVPALVHLPLPRPRRSRRARVVGWLGVAAALGLAMTPLVQDRLLRNRPEQLAAIRSTVDRISSALPALPTSTPAKRPPSVSATEEAVTPPDVRQPSPPRAPVEDSVALSPSFATVGSAAFYRKAGDGDGGLIPAGDRDEGSILRITRVVDDRAKNFHARPSPDGQRIAFDSDRDGERGIYVASLDGTNVRRVSGGGYAAIPSWSPDGDRLAFARAEQEQPKVWNLWTVDLASGEMHRLTSHRVGQPWGASWFPDGSRIAYSLEDRLVIHDLDSGREKTFTSPRKGQLIRTPAVSPDGKRVIFQIYRDGAWLLNLSDESMRKVLADPTAEEYSWSPDGRRVAYHSRRSGQWGVWLMASR